MQNGRIGSGQGAWIMMIEAHVNVIEHQCVMMAKRLMHILPEKPFYVYIQNWKAKPVNLPKLMKVPYESNASTSYMRKLMSAT